LFDDEYVVRFALLDVRPDGAVQQCGEGMPGRCHSDGHGQSSYGEGEGRGPHGGAVDAVERDEVVDDDQENHDAEAGDGSCGGRKPDAVPGKAAEGSFDETDGGEQDEALVCVGPAPCTPRSVDDDGEADDADRGYCKGDGGVERADPHSAVESVESSDHAEHDHDGRKAEGDDAEGAVPFDAARGDEGGLDSEQQHPEREDRAVDVKDGAGKRRAHHAGLEVGRREADENADA